MLKVDAYTNTWQKRALFSSGVAILATGIAVAALYFLAGHTLKYDNVEKLMMENTSIRLSFLAAGAALLGFMSAWIVCGGKQVKEEGQAQTPESTEKWYNRALISVMVATGVAIFAFATFGLYANVNHNFSPYIDDFLTKNLIGQTCVVGIGSALVGGLLAWTLLGGRVEKKKEPTDEIQMRARISVEELRMTVGSSSVAEPAMTVGPSNAVTNNVIPGVDVEMFPSTPSVKATAAVSPIFSGDEDDD